MRYNPWLHVWVHPRRTIREIIKKNPNYRLGVLSAIYGFAVLFDLSKFLSLGYYFNPIIIWIASIVFSAIAGYLVFCFSAWLIFNTGRWLGEEKTSFAQIRSAIAWSNVPITVYIIGQILLYIFFGDKLFLNFPAAYNLNSAETLQLLIILCVQLAIGVWIFVLYLQTLAEVRHFSIPKVIFNLILALIVFAVILFILWFAFRASCTYFFDQPIMT